MNIDVKCNTCNNVMIFRYKIEDTEENSVITLKDMYYCKNCDSYEFIIKNNLDTK